MPLPHPRFFSHCLRFVLLLSVVITVHAAEQLSTQGQNVMKDVRRIVFLGDSITQKGDYVADVECWLLSRGIEVEVLNLGLGSETATDLTVQENEEHLKKYGFGRVFVSERLDRVLAETKPDLLFACYGMNDTSLPTDESGLQRYAQAITSLREKVLASGVKRVVLLTPPIHDNKPSDQKLTRYTSWLLGKRNEGWLVVDIHTPMRSALDAARTKNPAFLFAEDGVHPSREGHWLMAREILKQAFGEAVPDFYCSEQLFPFLGAEIRDQVRLRQELLFNAWMTKIGHTRPNVAGGPRGTPGQPLPEAEAKAKTINEQIRKKLILTNLPNP